MSPANLLRLILLAAIWGGSYALMRVLAPVYGGIGTMWLRISIAAIVLLVYTTLTKTELGFKQWWRQYLVIGMMNSAIPFSLIGFGMKTLPAGYGALINSLAPFFGVLFAALMLSEKLTLPRVLGLITGFAGVGVMLNLGPVVPTREVVIAALSCVLATASYGFASVFTKKYAKGAPNFGLTTFSLALPTVILAPLAIPLISWQMPSTGVLLALLTLGVVCSGVAYFLYFRLIADVGPTKATSVTFLIPVFGVTWGALFFDERLTLGALAGAVLIFVGVALVLGLKWPSRRVK